MKDLSKISSKNLTIVLATALIGVSLVAFAFLNYKVKIKELEIEKRQLEKEYLISDQTLDKQKKLEECLSKAQEDYKKYFVLNSIAGTTPGGDEARKWNSPDSQTRAQDTLSKDKDFCLKLYNL